MPWSPLSHSILACPLSKSGTSCSKVDGWINRSLSQPLINNWIVRLFKIQNLMPPQLLLTASKKSLTSEEFPWLRYLWHGPCRKTTWSVRPLRSIWRILLVSKLLRWLFLFLTRVHEASVNVHLAPEIKYLETLLATPDFWCSYVVRECEIINQ